MTATRSMTEAEALTEWLGQHPDEVLEAEMRSSDDAEA